MREQKSVIWKNTRGDEIDDTRVVFINCEVDASGKYSVAKLGDEDAEDYAYVHGFHICREHVNCRLLYVTYMSQAYPSTDEVHANNDTKYTVAWRK